MLGLTSEEDDYSDNKKTLWNRLFAKQVLDKENTTQPKSKKQIQYAQTGGFGQYRHLIHALAICFLALLIMLPANRYFKGMIYGSQGMYEMSQGNLLSGREYMVKAMEYDPYTSSYAIDIAKTYIQQFFVTGDPQDAETAKMYLEQAMEISPNSLDTKVTCFKLLHVTGYYDEAADVALSLIHI